LHLPELKPLIGKLVEITIKEERAAEMTPASVDWAEAERAAEMLRESGYDFDAWRLQRENDLRHAQDHLP
jgi:hypothetical protein